MEKPVEVVIPDSMEKNMIQEKISRYTSYQNAVDAKKELVKEQRELKILENLVLYLDSKTGVRGYILKKVVEPLRRWRTRRPQDFTIWSLRYHLIMVLSFMERLKRVMVLYRFIDCHPENTYLQHICFAH